MNVMAQAHKTTKALMAKFKSFPVPYKVQFKACLKQAHELYKEECKTHFEKACKMAKASGNESPTMKFF